MKLLVFIINICTFLFYTVFELKMNCEIGWQRGCPLVANSDNCSRENESLVRGHISLGFNLGHHIVFLSGKK